MTLETAFTMDTSSIKYGPGVTREVGWDMEEQGARRVMVVTDPYLTESETTLLKAAIYITKTLCDSLLIDTLFRIQSTRRMKL